MPFDPNQPAQGSPLSSALMRGQLNALNEKIPVSIVIDEVSTLEPDQPATASAALIDGVLHLTLGLPRGATGPGGPDGATGNDGPPGEVSLQQLNEAIAITARYPVGVATLDTPYADPSAEELRVAYNTLVMVLLRPST